MHTVRTSATAERIRDPGAAPSLGGQSLVEGAQDDGSTVEEHHARLGRIDPAVVPTKGVTRELGYLTSHLHPCGSCAHHDESEPLPRRLGIRLDLGELEVSDIMIHRTAMRAVNADEPPEVAIRNILESPYTRMPVWRGATDNIIGVIHAKDLIRALAEPNVEPQDIDIVKIAQKPWFVPDTTNLKDQLNAFLRRKTHFAVVVDEYGEVQGVVTLEDILEEIVGDISDEHDLEIQGVRQDSDGSIVVDGGVPIRKGSAMPSSNTDCTARSVRSSSPSA